MQATIRVPEHPSANRALLAFLDEFQQLFSHFNTKTKSRAIKFITDKKWQRRETAKRGYFKKWDHQGSTEETERVSHDYYQLEYHYD